MPNLPHPIMATLQLQTPTLLITALMMIFRKTTTTKIT